MKASKLSLELIIVLFRLNESIWLLDGPCGSGHLWLTNWFWLWYFCCSCVQLDEPPVPGIDSTVYSFETI